jgi:hypothetical protein
MMSSYRWQFERRAIQDPDGEGKSSETISIMVVIAAISGFVLLILLYMQVQVHFVNAMCRLLITVPGSDCFGLLIATLSFLQQLKEQEPDWHSWSFSTKRFHRPYSKSGVRRTMRNCLSSRITSRRIQRGRFFNSSRSAISTVLNILQCDLPRAVE